MAPMPCTDKAAAALAQRVACASASRNRSITALRRSTSLQALAQIKAKRSLHDMALLRVGRLSVSPVTEKEFKAIRVMAGEKP